jgi:ADP-ribosylglycohydrolase
VTDLQQRRSRARGCLLAGAIGDALGAPVEFDALVTIRSRFGPSGVTDFVPSPYGSAGLVTDDTQMTLFTAEALLATDPPELGDRLHAAYRRWLATQEQPAPREGATGLAAQPWLYAARAPGNACLSGLRAAHRGTVAAPVNAGSKGCGTVTRSAPFGLSAQLSTSEAVAEAAITGACLTHGHPTARLAAAAFAVIVRHLVDGHGLAESVSAATALVARYPGHEETTAALGRAVAAADGPATPERLHRLGKGWIAEEALAMSVYAVLTHPDPDQLRAALLFAVNHDGDSDSTGAITGNLLGALHGDAAVPADWAAQVEGRDTVLHLGARLVAPEPRVITLTVQRAEPEAVRRTGRLSRVRGLLLGLALGDALARAQPHPVVLLGTSTTQLACFTVEGLIRGLVRAAHRGIGPGSGVVWNAYRRWARIQGIPVADPIKLNGWLHRVPALHERRGNAPAMVAALTAATGPHPQPGPTTSRGHHALTRTLPLACTDVPDRWTEEVVSMTHGHPDAVQSALTGVTLARAATSARSVADAVASLSHPLLDGVLDGRPLHDLAPDHKARSALRGGAALAATCADPSAIADTLHRARHLPAPAAVGPIAGALLGAVHGVEALPVEFVGQLELAWPMEVLARDLVSQLEDGPSGHEYQRAADPHWWDRYPGG